VTGFCRSYGDESESCSPSSSISSAGSSIWSWNTKTYCPEADISAGVMVCRDRPNNLTDDNDLQARRLAFANSANPKCHDKPGYQWLYRHDREWLVNYVAANPYLRDRKIRIEQSRDFTLASELAKARAILLSVHGKPQQVTRAALCRLVVNAHAFLKMPEHFPRSIRLMADLLESTHDHQLVKSGGQSENTL
jgi:hypothetical protein